MQQSDFFKSGYLILIKSTVMAALDITSFLVIIILDKNGAGIIVE